MRRRRKTWKPSDFSAGSKLLNAEAMQAMAERIENREAEILRAIDQGGILLPDGQESDDAGDDELGVIHG